MGNIMKIFDDVTKFIKDVAEQVEDKIEDIIEDIADIFDGDNEDETEDAE
jgi:hypothetical protein